MKYNPRSSLRQSQVEFRRGRRDTGGDGGHLYGDRFADLNRNRVADKLTADSRILFGGKKRKFSSARSEQGYANSYDEFYARLRRDAIKDRLRRRG